MFPSKDGHGYTTDTYMVEVVQFKYGKGSKRNAVEEEGFRVNFSGAAGSMEL